MYQTNCRHCIMKQVLLHPESSQELHIVTIKLITLSTSHTTENMFCSSFVEHKMTCRKLNCVCCLSVWHNCADFNFILILAHCAVNGICCKFVLGHRQHSCEVSWPAVQNNPIKVCPIGHLQSQEPVHWCPTGRGIVLFDRRPTVLFHLCVSYLFLYWCFN